MREQLRGKWVADPPTPHFFTGRPGLLERFRQGDPQALSEVYWAHVHRVEEIIRRALRLNGGGSRAGSEVEDLVQETFVKAFGVRARESYDGIRDYLPYLTTIARNTLIDSLRARGRDLLVTSADLEAIAATDDGHAATDESWSDPRTMATVETYLGQLPSDLAGVHEQLYVVGVSQQVAAKSLGISRQTLRTLDKKVRAGLRRALKKMSGTKNL